MAATEDTAPLLELARQAAERAGAELLSRRDHVGPVDTKTSTTDPVSDADRASERLLVETLLEARPDDGVLGEEGSSQTGSSGVSWVLDPLDGTVNYLYGFPAWCISVAAEDEQGALVGVVREPLRGETFMAARSEGAWLRQQRLSVNDPVMLEQALIATGFAYQREHRRQQARVAAEVAVHARDLRRAGSAALDLCWVAAGRLDGYYEDSVSKWDWAAGALIAAEAGANVGVLPGPDEREGVVAAGPGLYGPLRDLVTAGG